MAKVGVAGVRTLGKQSTSERIRTAGHRAAYNFARAVVRDAKINAPKRTGYMASQIQRKKIRDGVHDIFVKGNVDAETGAYYAVYVEYGTRHMAAQPFFRPAVEKNKRQFLNDMRLLP